MLILYETSYIEYYSNKVSSSAKSFVFIKMKLVIFLLLIKFMSLISAQLRAGIFDLVKFPVSMVK